MTDYRAELEQSWAVIDEKKAEAWRRLARLEAANEAMEAYAELAAKFPPDELQLEFLEAAEARLFHEFWEKARAWEALRAVQTDDV